MIVHKRWRVVALLAFFGCASAGPASAQSVSEPEAVVRSVLLHLRTSLAGTPAVVDLREVCSAAATGTCSSEFKAWLASLGMRPRVEGSRSYCITAEPPCAGGGEVLVRLGVPDIQGATATLRLQRWQPSRTAREPLLHVESDVVLSRPDGWRVEREELRWRS
jgi:hypothetical protein